MNKKLFAELVGSMEQMNEIARGERAPSREFHVEPLAIKETDSSPEAVAQGIRPAKFIKKLRNYST